METSLRKILTPTSSLDLLREIDAVTTTTSQQQQQPRPYVISIVGVNGVGKSTSLAKLCYFLLQNRHRVLIAACDTFRSGAVEQLRVHARNLAELAAREQEAAAAAAAAAQSSPLHSHAPPRAPAVELYERGYGRDAAAVARDAVAHGAAHGFSVVLVDTAGRQHNDARLMAALGKFAALARPDKVFMVGEALVGADAVAQARHFGEAFGMGAGPSSSSSPPPPPHTSHASSFLSSSSSSSSPSSMVVGRGLDGFIVSKCDTVGDMVGALVSLVFATGVPVAFLGTGQHYGDLRTLNIAWAVRLLMA
jgi:signal recognition particle receptor subunit alpha